MQKPKTTADLRATLFDCIEKVKSGQMAPSTAASVCKVSAQIVDTARLELDYSETLSRLDKQDQGITTGPLLLTQGEST